MSTPSDVPEERAPRREPVTLSDGTVAHLVPRDGGWTLEVDGVRQSQVGAPGAPPALAAVRWMLAAVGKGRLSCAHLGGGLLALPRALAEQDRGSRHVVVEHDPVLVDLARTRFGLPLGVTVEVGEARAWLAAGRASGLDAVVIDIFAGNRIPPAFTSRECFAAARSVLSDSGVLVLNSVAGPDLSFTRRELASLRAEFDHVAMIVQGSALKGLRFGNAVLVASAAPLDIVGIRAALDGDSSRGALVTELEPIIDGAQPVSDEDELWSPVPDLPRFGEALRLLDKVRSMRAAFQPDQ